MTEESTGQRVRVDASELRAAGVSTGARISASGVITNVDAAGQVITLEELRVALDGRDVALTGQTLIIAAEDTLRSSFKKNAAKLAWTIPAGICASLLLALVVAADYNDLLDIEPRYWELLLKVIAVCAGIWFLYAVVTARGLKTIDRVAGEFADEIAPNRTPPP